MIKPALNEQTEFEKPSVKDILCRYSNGEISAPNVIPDIINLMQFLNSRTFDYSVEWSVDFRVLVAQAQMDSVLNKLDKAIEVLRSLIIYHRARYKKFRKQTDLDIAYIFNNMIKSYRLSACFISEQ